MNKTQSGRIPVHSIGRPIQGSPFITNTYHLNCGIETGRLPRPALCDNSQLHVHGSTQASMYSVHLLLGLLVPLSLLPLLTGASLLLPVTYSTKTNRPVGFRANQGTRRNTILQGALRHGVRWLCALPVDVRRRRTHATSHGKKSRGASSERLSVVIIALRPSCDTWRVVRSDRGRKGKNVKCKKLTAGNIYYRYTYNFRWLV